MKSSLMSAVFFVGLATACGGGQNEPETAGQADADGASEASTESAPSEAAPESDDQAPAEGPWDIPTSCHEGSAPCTANPKWVKALCADVYPAVALYLFSPQAPFTHGYLSRKTRAVNASGGATSGDAWLAFDEEVVLLHHRAADLGGMQVSGAGGGYEAMRMDGSCVTLGSDEVRMQKPPKPKYAKVPWRYIGDDMQDAVRESEKVKDAYIARRKECKGAFSGEVTSKCVTLDGKLNEAIVEAVMSGAVTLPQPQRRP